MSQISKLEATTQLTSPNFPLLPDETPEEFEAYRSRIIGALKPSNALSENIAEDIVSAHWEIHRLERWRSIMIRDRAKKYDEEHAGEDLSQDEIGISNSIAKDNLAAAQAEIDQKLEGRAKLFLTLYDWQFSENPSYFEAGLLAEIDDVINEDLLSDPNYFASVNYFKDLKLRLRMEAKMMNPAFMKQLKLNDRYLDEAQSKRRTAIRSIIRAGQDATTPLE